MSSEAFISCVIWLFTGKGLIKVIHLSEGRITRILSKGDMHYGDMLCLLCEVSIFSMYSYL